MGSLKSLKIFTKWNDKTSSYAVLLGKTHSTTLHVRRIKAIACEVFKSLNDLNPSFTKEMFEKKDALYGLRDSNILYQPIVKKITYGKKHLNTMVLTSGMYYLKKVQTSIHIRIWLKHGKDNNVNVWCVVSEIKDYVCHMTILSLILYRKCFSFCK